MHSDSQLQIPNDRMALNEENVKPIDVIGPIQYGAICAWQHSILGAQKRRRHRRTYRGIYPI